MNLTLQRTNYGPEATEGQLTTDDGTFSCVTLEPFARAPDAQKVMGKTAIPAGTYPIELTFSPKFGQVMPLLDNIPNFEAVRIHWGNSDVDTDGCILVGQDAASADWVTESRATFALLFPKISAAVAAGESCSITVIDGPGAPQ